LARALWRLGAIRGGVLYAAPGRGRQRCAEPHRRGIGAVADAAENLHSVLAQATHAAMDGGHDRRGRRRERRQGGAGCKRQRRRGGAGPERASATGIDLWLGRAGWRLLGHAASTVGIGVHLPAPASRGGAWTSIQARTIAGHKARLPCAWRTPKPWPPCA